MRNGKWKVLKVKSPTCDFKEEFYIRKIFDSMKHL
jgi:hypothetical protein